MTLIEDVGQKVGQHDNIAAFCAQNGIILRRQKLNVGDYQLAPRVSIDTKKGMQEIYSDVVSDHERFRNECIRAQEDGIRLVILIEDSKITNLDEARKWKNPRYAKWERDNRFVLEAQKAGRMLSYKVPRAPVESDRLVNMMCAMSMKYGVEWQFCRPEDTGQTILKILTETG